MTVPSVPGEGLIVVLQSQIAVMESYEHAIHRLKGSPCALELMLIRDHHQDAAERLRKHVDCAHDQSSSRTNQWAIEQGAEFVKQIAFATLQAAEEYGIAVCREALQDETLTPECRERIQKIAEQCKDHIEKLECIKC